MNKQSLQLVWNAFHSFFLCSLELPPKEKLDIQETIHILPGYFHYIKPGFYGITRIAVMLEIVATVRKT